MFALLGEVSGVSKSLKMFLCSMLQAANPDTASLSSPNFCLNPRMFCKVGCTCTQYGNMVWSMAGVLNSMLQ